MLALRLARNAHPLVLLRRLLVAAASAGVGFLLLCALAHAMAHPDRSAASVLRLAWCVPPLAAAVYLAVAVARTDPSTRPRPGLSSLGLGPGRLAAIAAASTAVSCTLGSALALLFFLHLRGDLTGLPFDRRPPTCWPRAGRCRCRPRSPLLAVTPAAASAAAALSPCGRAAAAAATDAPGTAADGTVGGAARTGASTAASAPRRPATPSTRRPRRPACPGAPPSSPSAWPSRSTAHGAGTAPGCRCPAGCPGITLGVLAGWALTAVGLAVAGPGLAHLCGRVVQAYRPGATRLLAGRALMDEARRVGRPLGVLSAVVAAWITAAELYGQAAGARPFGPLAGLGAALVLACAAATVLSAALETRQLRAGSTAALIRLGAPAALLRSAALLRAAVLLAVFAPVTWAVATLTALPLTS